MEKNETRGVEVRSRPLDPIGTLIRDQTLSALLGQIYDESEPDTADRLSLRMVDEEDRFGRLQERLDKLDKLIADVRIHIRSQTLLVERLEGEGLDIAMAGSILESHRKAYRVFCEYKDLLQTKISFGYDL